MRRHTVIASQLQISLSIQKSPFSYALLMQIKGKIYVKKKCSYSSIKKIESKLLVIEQHR